VKDNIKINLEEKWEGLDWFHLDKDTDRWRSLVSIIRKLRVP
jgi:hypothetical protein